MASTERAPDAGAAAAGRDAPPAPPAPPAAGGDSFARAAATAAANRLLLFAVHGRLYGCHIDAVREIVPFRPCTRLPSAPPYVCGLINLRGTIVTVLDLGVRLGGAAVNRAEGSIVLVENGPKVVGLGVDELRDVQPVTYEPVAPGAQSVPLPEAPGAAGAAGAAGSEEPRADPGGLILGLGALGGEVVVVLDVRAIVKQALL